MFTQLKNIHPIARKEHTCMLCGKKIKKGEAYERQTNLYDGDVCDWIECNECETVSHELGMYDHIEEEFLTEDDFREAVFQYVNNNHSDKETDDISKEWQLPFLALVEKVYHELLEKKNHENNFNSHVLEP